MGRRKVGDTPFDLYAYFEVIDNIAMPDRAYKEDAVFTNVFMPTLREWSVHCMEKTELKRESLAKVVGDACHQSWKKISKEPIQFSDIKSRNRSQPAISKKQHQRILVEFKNSEEFISWLDAENGIPQPHPTPTNDPPTKEQKADFSKFYHSPQRLDPMSQQSTAPPAGADSRLESEKPSSHPMVDFGIDQVPLASDATGSGDPYDEPLELVTASSWDYWAEPDNEIIGNFIEAPKIPRCGPWEIPLPPNMDTSVFVEPYMEQINLMLGISIESNSRPPAVCIKLTKKQQAHISASPNDAMYQELVNSLRWKASSALFAWARHLKDQASTRNSSPLGIVEFTGNYLIEEGVAARKTSISNIRSLGNRPMFVAREYKLPETRTMKRKLADTTALSEATEPRSRQRSSTPVPESTRTDVCTNNLAGPRPRAKVDAVYYRKQSPTAAGSQNNTTVLVNSHPSTNRSQRKRIGPFLSDEEDEDEVKIEDE